MKAFVCFYTAVLVLGMIFIMAGCGQESEDPVGAKSNDLYIENDPNETKSPEKNLPESVSMKVGETVKMTLESNPTTGYQWTAKVDSGFMTIVKEDYVSSSKLLGAGGVQEFEFKALNAGKTNITMDYGRSWEPNPINTYSIPVNIE